MREFFRRLPWLPWTLLIGTAIAVVVAAGITTPDRAQVRERPAVRRDLACVRPELGPNRGIADLVGTAHVGSVRSISDSTAPNYCSPTDPRWGVLGAFPGDTTIVLARGTERVAVRLVGRPGRSLAVVLGGRSYPIVAVYGGGIGWKQRYITVRDELHYMLPIEWDEQHRAWEPYGLERWLATGGPDTPRKDDSLEGRCADCHGGTRADHSGMVFVGADGMK